MFTKLIWSTLNCNVGEIALKAMFLPLWSRHWDVLSYIC